MSYIRYIKQNRLNTDILFFSPSADAIAKMDEYVASGKIENYNLDNVSGNELYKEIKIVFNNTTSFDEFINEEIILNSKLARNNHCSTNHISYSLEEE